MVFQDWGVWTDRCLGEPTSLLGGLMGVQTLTSCKPLTHRETFPEPQFPSLQMDVLELPLSSP